MRTKRTNKPAPDRRRLPGEGSRSGSLSDAGGRLPRLRQRMNLADRPRPAPGSDPTRRRTTARLPSSGRWPPLTSGRARRRGSFFPHVLLSRAPSAGQEDPRRLLARRWPEARQVGSRHGCRRRESSGPIAPARLRPPRHCGVGSGGLGLVPFAQRALFLSPSHSHRAGRSRPTGGSPSVSGTQPGRRAPAPMPGLGQRSQRRSRARSAPAAGTTTAEASPPGPRLSRDAAATAVRSGQCAYTFAIFAKRAKCSRNARRTDAVGPLRCFATMTSAVPRSGESGS